MAKIIKFPPRIPPEEKVELDHELDVAREAISDLVQFLHSYRYYAMDDEQLFDDIGVIYTLLYSALLRYEMIDHPAQDILDELVEILKDEETNDFE